MRSLRKLSACCVSALNLLAPRDRAGAIAGLFATVEPPEPRLAADLLDGQQCRGIQRTTHDLDFVIQLLPFQVGMFVEISRSEDYFVVEAMIRSAYQPLHQFNLIHIPSALKVDFWLLKSNESEPEMFRRKVRDSWLGEPVCIATGEDVTLHKLSWNKRTPSDRQLSDVAGAGAVQTGKRDEDYLRHWAVRLDVTQHQTRTFSGELRPKPT